MFGIPQVDAHPVRQTVLTRRFFPLQDSQAMELWAGELDLRALRLPIFSAMDQGKNNKKTLELPRPAGGQWWLTMKCRAVHPERRKKGIKAGFPLSAHILAAPACCHWPPPTNQPTNTPSPHPRFPLAVSN